MVRSSNDTRLKKQVFFCKKIHYFIDIRQKKYDNIIGNILSTHWRTSFFSDQMISLRQMKIKE